MTNETIDAAADAPELFDDDAAPQTDEQPAAAQPQPAAVPSGPVPAPLPARPSAPQPQPQPPEQEQPQYRYVLRPLQAAFHIWEETTGERVTHTPLTSEHDAEELVRLYNRKQAPPV